MKKRSIILLAILIIGSKLFGQSYYVINFESTGSDIDSIKVENITQGNSKMLNEADILHLLLEPSAIYNLKLKTQPLTIFPNPMINNCNIQFYNTQQGIVKIMLTSITGKEIYKYSHTLSKGNHTFNLSGIPSGSYIIKVQSETSFLTGTLISLKESNNPISIKHSNTTNSKNHYYYDNNKNNKSIIELDYTIGDELKFIGYANGMQDAVIFDSPTNDETYNFAFTTFECGEPYIDSRDGKVYKTVKIGDQCWLAENLKYLPVDEEFDNAEEGSLTEPFYYVYDFATGGSIDDLENDSAFVNYNTYGILYNWSASMGWDGQGDPPSEGVQGICPNGWHLPTHDEWTTMEKNVGSDPDAFPYGGNGVVGFLGTDEGDAIKDINAGWCNDTTNCGTSGFNALPGGRRYSSGIFYGIGTGARWWTSTEWGAGAWRRYLEDVQPGINRFTDYKTFGFSVRCIKN